MQIPWELSFFKKSNAADSRISKGAQGKSSPIKKSIAVKAEYWVFDYPLPKLADLVSAD
jgi:hypothetical protein